MKHIYWILAVGAMIVVAVTLFIGILPGTIKRVPGEVELILFKADSPPPEYPPEDWVVAQSMLEAGADVLSLEFDSDLPCQDTYGLPCLELKLSAKAVPIWHEFNTSHPDRWSPPPFLP